MAMLDEADRSKYFPFVALRGDALSGAILSAETQANAAAGRNLELTEYIEIVPTFTHLVPLRYYPVNNLRPMRVQATYGSADLSIFHQSFSGSLENLPSEYSLNTSLTDIDCSQYQVNQDGLMHISNSLVGSWLKITYWAGFDFSSEAIEVQRLKAAVAAILNYEVLG